MAPSNGAGPDYQLLLCRELGRVELGLPRGERGMTASYRGYYVAVAPRKDFSQEEKRGQERRVLEPCEASFKCQNFKTFEKSHRHSL